jgi:tetratricopeptide (TPR) repeat protein
MPHPSAPDAPAPRPPPHALVLGAVALLALLVYANALRNGYALDDERIILLNPALHGLGNLHATLLEPYWKEAADLYRPITLLSFAVGWAVHGGAPGPMHLVNALLHALCAAGVALLVLRLRGGLAAAALAGAVFAVHPVHVEAVANGVGRAEVLATLFVLAGCLVYLGAPRLSPGRMAAVAGLYLLALGSKEIAVGFPGLLVVVDALRAREERKTAWALVRGNLPLLGVLAAALGVYVLLRGAATGGLLGAAPAPYLIGVSAARRVATAVRVWPEYLRLLFWPADLSAEWGPDTIGVVGWGSPHVWLGVAVGAALAACAVLSWRRDRWVAAAVAWFALAVLPVANLLFVVGVILSERSLYLPSVALAFLCPPLVAAVSRARRETRIAGAAGAAALLLLGAGRTWTRTPDWASSRTVHASMMRDHPELWWVHWNAATILVRQGRLVEALPWYRSAMDKVGWNHELMDVGYVLTLRDVGRFPEAEPVLRHAVRTFRRAVPPHLLLASLLIDQGRYAEALPLLDTAARIPRFGALSAGQIADQRALAYDGMGRLGPALEARRASLRDPRVRRGISPWYHYARLLAEAGDSVRARDALEVARSRAAPRVRPLMGLDPLPSLRSPLIRGWGSLPEMGPPPPAPALPPVPRGG